MEGSSASIVELTTGEVVVAGSSFPYSMATQINGEIVKLDSNGVTLWRRVYGGNRNDYFYDLIVHNHDYSGKSGYVLCGRTESNLPPGRADAWLVRLNCMGLLTVPQAAFIAAPLPAQPHVIALVNQSQYVYLDSIDGGHYIVNWGDGSPPYICGQGYAACTGSLPTHTYQSGGLYPVTLQAIVCNDTSTLTRAVCIGFAPNPQATFSHEVLDYTVLFTNLSQNAYFAQGGYCVWDFGDGSPPVYETNPTHTFTENGNYPVTLTVVVCQDTSVYMQFVQVQTVGVSPPFFEGGQGGEQVVVYPNPAQNLLHFTLQNPLTPTMRGWQIALYTPAGQRVLHHVESPVGTPATASVEIGHLPVGIYFYTVQSGGVALARGKVAVVR